MGQLFPLFFVDIMVKYASVSSKISFHIPYVNIFLKAKGDKFYDERKCI